MKLPDNPTLWTLLHSEQRFRPQYPSERVVQFLSPCSGTFLDFGCGAGRHMKLASELGLAVYGWDISSIGTEYARKWGRIGELSSFQDDFFDVIVCYGVLYYFPSVELDSVIAELRRVLKGRMLLVLRSRKDYRIHYSKSLGRGDYLAIDGPGRVHNERGMLMHFFSKTEIMQRFSGFSEIQIDEQICTTQGGKFRDHDYVVLVSK